LNLKYQIVMAVCESGPLFFSVTYARLLPVDKYVSDNKTLCFVQSFSCCCWHDPWEVWVLPSCSC